MFHGDPNDPRLSTEERRLLKRRIVNRESARRVRLRLRTDLEEQQRLICSRPLAPTPQTLPGQRAACTTTRFTFPAFPWALTLESSGACCMSQGPSGTPSPRAMHARRAAACLTGRAVAMGVCADASSCGCTARPLMRPHPGF